MSESGNQVFSRWYRAVTKCLVVLSCLLLAGCYGGDDDAPTSGHGTPETVTVQGVVQKGLFPTLAVQVSVLDPNTLETIETIQAATNAPEFTATVPSNSLVLLEANGEFVNDVTGGLVQLDEPLRAILEVGGGPQTANINIATTLVAARVLETTRDLQVAFAEIIALENRFVAEVLGLGTDTDPSSLDYRNISATSTLTDPNLQLLLLSAGLSGALTSDSLYSGGFGTVVEQVVNAETPAEGISALNVLSGLPLLPTYSAVQLNSGLPYLPDLGISNEVYSCIELTVCSWLPAGTPSISVSSAVTYESQGFVRVFVRLSEPSVDDVFIRVASVVGTATEGKDYPQIQKSLAIPAGSIAAYFDLPIVVDSLDETDEVINFSIDTDHQNYGVLLGDGRVQITDGYPASLLNQDVTDIGISSLCLYSVGEPGFETSTTCSSDFSALGIKKEESLYASLGVELWQSCPTYPTCSADGKDWLVDFYLIAENSLSVDQTEQLLGSYEHAGARLSNDLSDPSRVIVSLDTPAISAAIDTAEQSGWSLRIEARLNGDASKRQATALPPVVEVPESIQAGSYEVPFGHIYEVNESPGVACGAGQIQITAELQFSVAGQNTGTACYTFGPDDDVAVLAGGAIALDSVFLELPEGLTAQIGRLVDETPGPGFDNTVVPTGFPGLILGEYYFLDVAESKLHVEGIPFSFVISGAELGPDGLQLSYTRLHYIMDKGYAQGDPRQRLVNVVNGQADGNGQVSHLYSNDFMFAGVGNQSGTVLLTDTGLTGTVAVAARDAAADGGGTAYPKAEFRWAAFEQQIADSKLLPVTMSSIGFDLEQSTACKGADCLNVDADALSVSATNAVMDSRGAVLADAVLVSESRALRWGVRETDSGTEAAWSRPGDLPPNASMKMALPGFVAPAGERVSDYLLSHLNESELPGNDHRVYPLFDEQAVDGNYHPVGLSLGPEVYRGGDGLPLLGTDGQDLAGNLLVVNNGIDAQPVSVPTALATKYVIRNSGITGVFNASPSAVAGISDVEFYGYALDLNRFAVRLTDNVMDTYTWVDGSLTLNNDAGGQAGLQVFFDSLEISCSARLGNASLVYEVCDNNDNNGNGIIDENCGRELYAWQASIEVFTAGFEAPQQCAAANQSFALNHTVEFAALSKPVAFTTLWSPGGDLVSQRSTVAPSYRFDAIEDSQGFAIQAQQLNLRVADANRGGRNRYGWLGVDSTVVAVPFWESLEADLRIANDGDVAEPTVVAPKNELVSTNLDAVLRDPNQTNEALQRELIDAYVDVDNNADLFATYEWGGTGFSFSLPVYYQPWQFSAGINLQDPDAQGRQARFIGRTLETDLFVLQANAAVDFIETNRTKLSFGASADLDRLENVSFQLDITNPETAGSVDDFLETLGIIDGPLLKPALKDVYEYSDILNRYAGQGLEEAIRFSLDTALEEIGENAADFTPNRQDPFITISEALNATSSYPQQITSLLLDELREPLDQGLFSLEDELRSELLDIKEDLQILGPGSDQADIQAMIVKLESAKQLVEGMRDSVGPVRREFSNVLDVADAQSTTVIAAATELLAATQAVEQVLMQAVSFTETTCSSALVVDGEGNGYLDEVAVQFSSIRGLAGSLKEGDKLVQIINALQGNTDQASAADSAISDALDEVLAKLAVVDKTVRDAVCRPEDIDDVLAGAKVVLTEIRGAAETTQSAGLQLRGIINDLRPYEEFLYVAFELPMQSAINVLSSLQVFLEEASRSGGLTATGDELVSFVDLGLQQATNDLPDLGFIDSGAFQVYSLVETTAGQNDLPDVLFGIAKVSLDKAFVDIRTTLNSIVGEQLPATGYTPEELRALLVGELMRSQPFVELRETMGQAVTELSRQVNDVLLQFTNQINFAIRDAIKDFESDVNDVLADAKAVVRDLPLRGGTVDGAAVIAGNQLERAYLNAEWTMVDDNEDSTKYQASLEATSWSTRVAPDDINVAEACRLGGGEAALDVTISAYNLSLDMLGTEGITADKIYLGFTLENGGGGVNDPALIPMGIFGGVNIKGEIGYSEAQVLSPRFASGIGRREAYLGASGRAVISDIEADVAFLAGRLCPGSKVLLDLDPKIGKWLPFTADGSSGFSGAYVRGGATIPIIPGGCLLNVAAKANFGGWVSFDPPIYGGLIGGGARGEAACIAAIKGEVNTLLNSDAGKVTFIGNAWGAAGAGFCEPAEWDTKADSRRDDWCGTGDVEFDVRYEDDEWKYQLPSVDSVF